jgi:hypothetical protein
VSESSHSAAPNSSAPSCATSSRPVCGTFADGETLNAAKSILVRAGFTLSGLTIVCDPRLLNDDHAVPTTEADERQLRTLGSSLAGAVAALAAAGAVIATEGAALAALAAAAAFGAGAAAGMRALSTYVGIDGVPGIGLAGPVILCVMAEQPGRAEKALELMRASGAQRAWVQAAAHQQLNASVSS